MRRAGTIFLWAGLALGGCWVASCGGSAFQSGAGGTADAGVAGNGGPDASAGTGGAADGGTAGSGGVGGNPDGGAAGAAGSGGVGGNPDGGAAGAAGSGGVGGNPDGGAAGAAGSGGVGGNPDGGAAGTAGSGGTGHTGGSSGSGGHADGGTTTCTSTWQCPDGQFCSKSGCAASLVGTCEDRPTTCDNSESPVCGCDGITYWNDCIRRLHGEEASSNGKCDGATAMHCGGLANLQCAEPWATCAFIFQDNGVCAMKDPKGNCWALPDTCPQVVIGGNLRPCGPNPTTPCSCTCKAIKAGGTWYQDNTCPQ
jgi:hypothetical protein